MRKIVFITGSMGRGGAERVITILSDEYIKMGWNVRIAMLLHSFVDYEVNSSIEIADLSYKYGIKRGFFTTVYKLRKYLIKEKPDVVVSFMAQNSMILWLASLGLKFKTVMSERIDPSKSDRWLLLRKIINCAYEDADYVVFQTVRAKKYFNNSIQKKGIIIGNPIKVDYFATIQKQNKIVSVGRLVEQKNHKMLIDAFATIHLLYPKFVLEIYGEGPLRNELQNHINELNLNECIRLQGNRNNIHECISDANMFVLPSNFEGLSNALLEAMMMGIPCISTDCAGSDEVIIDGYNGLLVPVGNCEELTKAMISIIENKELSEMISHNAKESIQNEFNVEVIIKKWHDIIG